MKKYSFGVDVGGTTIKMGFFDVDGELLKKWEIKTRKRNGGSEILEDIAEQIQKTLAQRNISKDEVKGIGLGVPGPVRADGTVVKCINLGWDVFNVEEALARKTDLQVKSGNDANLAALGEMWKGGGKGYRDLLLVTLGTGVGGGIVVEGKMLSGSNGAAGEIGHMIVNENETETCACGKRGCVEQYASATGIARMAQKALTEYKQETVLQKVDRLTAKNIFDAAKQGDDFALEQVEKMGKILGTAIANTACVTNPEVIVIGGGVSKAGKILIDVLEKYFQKRTFHACSNAKFALAELGNDAGIYGGAYLIGDVGR
ncbi:MAG: ROK family glucokinase [Lachnospiraceae bacterium]|nr:ROK family glucokinase [Lachnospiraceae bacterium]